MQDPWPITMEQCAKRLHISRRTLQDLIRDYPFYRVAGRRKLFAEEDFKRLVNALPSPATGPHLAKISRRAGKASDVMLSELVYRIRSDKKGSRSSARRSSNPACIEANEKLGHGKQGRKGQRR